MQAFDPGPGFLGSKAHRVLQNLSSENVDFFPRSEALLLEIITEIDERTELNSRGKLTEGEWLALRDGLGTELGWRCGNQRARLRMWRASGLFLLPRAILDSRQRVSGELAPRPPEDIVASASPILTS